MALEQNYRDVARIESDIAEIHKKIAEESKCELDKQRQIDNINKSITGSTSPTTAQSKLNQMRSYQNDLVNIAKKKAELYKTQASYSQNLSKKRIEIAREEKKERE